MSSPRLDLAIKIQAWRLRELLKWREYLKALVEAAVEVFGEDVEVYVFGSVVEGGLTADSDIDIAIVLRDVPRRGLDRAWLLDSLWKAMESRGVPCWYPFEIHLVTREELALLKDAKLVRVH
jgi:predicted nucleotidyltransferase